MAGEEHYCDGRRRNLAALPGWELQRQRGKRFKSCTQNSKYDFIATLLHVRRLKGPSYIFYLHSAFQLKYNSACRKWTYWFIWVIWGKQPSAPNLKSSENGRVTSYLLSVREILCIYFFLFNNFHVLWPTDPKSDIITMLDYYFIRFVLIFSPQQKIGRSAEIKWIALWRFVRLPSPLKALVWSRSVPSNNIMSFKNVNINYWNYPDY